MRMMMMLNKFAFLFCVFLALVVGCALCQEPLLNFAGSFPSTPNAVLPIPPHRWEPECMRDTSRLHRASNFTYTFATPGVYRLGLWTLRGSFFAGQMFLVQECHLGPSLPLYPCGT
eukprot:TRINITY_DN25992_c0_g1_i1.p2 TRINITY_DN25992_c0_g1~~TRINITY_DN25992_c0_g1_i1.p2  ORF type:complete len:116 (-),score=4.25 TRINITY_DN25992_c0_g1_i1:236-583(-)